MSIKTIYINIEGIGKVPVKTDERDDGTMYPVGDNENIIWESLTKPQRLIFLSKYSKKSPSFLKKQSEKK